MSRSIARLLFVSTVRHRQIALCRVVFPDWIMDQVTIVFLVHSIDLLHRSLIACVHGQMSFVRSHKGGGCM